MSRFQISNSDSQLIEQIASGLSANKQAKPSKWLYATNSDGTIRWLWPSSNKSALFLSLYAQLNSKSHWIARFAKLAFTLKQGHFIANGNLDLKISDSSINKWHKQLGTNEVAIFTGTVGINRKAVIAFGNEGSAKWFVKLPLGSTSDLLIEKEIITLQNLQNYKFKDSEIPTILHLNDNYFAQRALQYTHQPQNLTAIHWQAFQEWKSSTAKSEILGESEFWLNLEAQFRKLILIKAHLKFPKHYELLRNIAGAINKEITICTGLSHQDFTPWNSGTNNLVLKVWDWELSNQNAPIGLDALHFVMQGEAMLNHNNFENIDKSWDSIYIQLSELLNEYPQHLKNIKALYLLSQVSKYLEIYHKQEVLHSQALHILLVWEQALTQEAEKLRPVKQRTNFINSVFNWLPNNAQYAWLKPTASHPSEISEFADIDIAICLKGSVRVLKFIEQSPTVKSVKKITFTDRIAVNISFNDGSRLNLDLLTAFRYKGKEYISIDHLLANAFKNESSISIPSPVFDWAYKSAFYSLNNSEIPARHSSIWYDLNTELQNVLLAEASNLVNYNFTSIDQLSERKVLSKVWNSVLSKNKSPFATLKAKTRYFSDVVKQVIKPRGAIITLSGVDGAGKSTILELIEKQLSDWRYPVVKLRHRPSLIPILSAYKYGKAGAEQRSAASLPRQGKNNNQLLSIVRFSYYLLDYIIGQWYVKLMYVSRGNLVIYDRYYFDFMADPRRSNLKLPAWLTKFCWKFIHTPNLNILLLAAPEVILKRKQELNLETIGYLNKQYGNTFESLALKQPDKYLQINNTNIQNTLATITHTLETRLGL